MNKNGKYLKDTVCEFNYNVQAIRFLAAVSVIISHAYAISLDQKDLFSIWSKGDISLGNLSVYVFLFLGGLYAAKSYDRMGSEKRNLKFICSKIKRLCPSLWVTVTITVCMIGPIFTSWDIKKYFLGGMRLFFKLYFYNPA